MKHTAPQLRILKEGELYGHFTMGGRGSDVSGDPIDQLVNFVQAYFIDWDLQDSKFQKLFHQTHPHANDRYLDEMGGMQQILLDELPTSNQGKPLIQVLLKKTKETGSTVSSIMEVLLADHLDLSVRAGAVLRDLNITTFSDLVHTPKSELLAHRHIGRVTLKEITHKVRDFFDMYGIGVDLPWRPSSPAEQKIFNDWISSPDPTKAHFQKRP